MEDNGVLMKTIIGHDYVNNTVGDIAKRLLNDRNSVMRSEMDKAILSNVRGIAASIVKKQKVILPYKISSDMELVFDEFYPEFQIEYKHNKLHSHAFAANSRILEGALLLKNMGYENLKGKIFQNYDFLVCDVGGNIFTHLSNGREDIHSCNPICGLYDGQRSSIRALDCIRFDRSRCSASIADQIDLLAIGESKLTCDKYAQDCEVKSLFGLFIHSIYDISYGDFFDIMEKKNMKEAWISVIFSPEILVEQKGIIPHLGCEFVVDHVADTILFSFVGDSSFCYRHKYSEYLKYFSGNCYRTKKGNWFTLETQSDRAGIRILTARASPITHNTNSNPLIHKIWFPKSYNKTMVRYFSWNYSTTSKKHSFLLRPKYFTVDTAVFHDILNYTNCLEDSRFVPKNVNEYTRSVSSRLIINGKSIQKRDGIEAEFLTELSHAIYLYSYEYRYSIGKIDKVLIDSLKEKREFKGKPLITRIKLYLASKFGFEKVISIIDCLVFSLYNFEDTSVSFTPAVTSRTYTSDSSYNLGNICSYLKHDRIIHKKFMAPKEFESDYKPPSVLDCIVSDYENYRMINIDDEGATHVDIIKKDEQKIFENSEVPTAPIASTEIIEKIERHSEDFSLKILEQTVVNDSLIPKSMYRTHESYSYGDHGVVVSSVKYRSIPNDGNGLCLFYSLCQSNDIDDVNTLKSNLLMSNFLNNYVESERENIMTILKAEKAWGETTIIDLYAFTYNKSVCLHYEDKFYNFGLRKEKPDLVLIYSDCHYTAGILEDLSDIDYEEKISFLDFAIAHFDTQLEMKREKKFARIFGKRKKGACFFTTMRDDSIKDTLKLTNDVKVYDYKVKLSECSYEVYTFHYNSQFPYKNSRFFYNFIRQKHVKSFAVIVHDNDFRDFITRYFLGSSFSLFSSDSWHSMSFTQIGNLDCDRNIFMNAEASGERFYNHFSVNKYFSSNSENIKFFNIAKGDIVLKDDKRVFLRRVTNVFNDGLMYELKRKLSSSSQTSFLGLFPDVITTANNLKRHEWLNSKISIQTTMKSFLITLETELQIKKRVICFISEVFLPHVNRFAFLDTISKANPQCEIVIYTDILINAFLVSQLSTYNCEPFKFEYNFENLKIYDSYRIERQIVDEIPRDIFDIAKISYKPIKKSNFLNNAGTKLDQILNRYHDININRFMDLCAGPGAMTACILNRFPNSRGHLHYYKASRKEAKLYPSVMNHSRVKICHLNQVSTYKGDLSKQTDVKLLIESVAKEPKMDFVSADGCISEGSGEGNHQLISGEVDVILSVIAHGGNAVLKIFDFLEYMDIIKRLIVNFEEICLYKPLNSNPLSQEIYVVAIGYHGLVKKPLHASMTRFYKQFESIYTNNLRVLKNFIEECNKLYLGKVKDHPLENDKVSEIISESETLSSDDNTKYKEETSFQHDANEIKVFNDEVVEDQSCNFERKRNIMKYGDMSYYQLPPSNVNNEMVWKEGARRGTNCFNPSFEEDNESNTDRRIKISNTVSECREIWRATHVINENNLRNFYKSYKLSEPDVDTKIFKLMKDAYGIIDNTTGAWIARNDKLNPVHSCAYDGTKLVNLKPFNETSKRAPNLFSPFTKSTILLVSDCTEVMVDKLLYESTEKFQNMDLQKLNVEITVGVPGCGKSYTTATECDPIADLILASTRDGLTSIVEKINTLRGVAKGENMCTVHSYLINGKREHEVVWIDEAFMRHAGEIIMVAMKSKCKKLYLIGDTAQIPYFVRTPQIVIRYEKIYNLFDRTATKYASYRVPMDIAYMFRDVYDYKFVTYNRVTYSLSLQVISCLADIPKRKDVQYLVFKRSEKQSLILGGYEKVNTIGEFQGCQCADIILVRLSSIPVDGIYEDKCQILVGLTRHTRSLKYYTYYGGDKISNMINRSKVSLQTLQVASALHPGGHEIILETKADSMIDCGMKDLILKSNGCQIRPMTIIEDETYFIYHPLNSVLSRGGDVSIIQNFYDYVLPGNSLEYYDNDQMLVENSDLNFTLENVSLDLSKKKPMKIKGPYLKPILRTSMAANRTPTMIDAILGVIKRNLYVPQLEGVNDKQYIATTMLERFIETFIGGDSLDLFNMFEKHKIFINEGCVWDWYKGQSPVIIKQIKGEKAISDFALDHHQLMNKPQVKPCLTTAAPWEYAAVQTIAYQDKDINAIMCPIFKMAKKRLLAVLKKNFLIYTDMSPEEFTVKLNERFTPEQIFGGNNLEIDMSKYDKSQYDVLFEFEMLLYSRLGIEDEILQLWRNGHEFNTLIDYNNGVKANLAYQRKSGDASTFFGNTCVLMGMLCMLFDIDAGVFSGDDSLLFDLDYVDMNEVCGQLFNMESKFFKFTYPYFCSKYLLFDGNSTVMVPDLIKLITKLGRRDLVNYEHLEEYRISLTDLTKSLDNASIMDHLAQAISERYSVHVKDVSPVVATIINCIRNKNLFNKLFYIRQGDVLSTDISRPKLD